MLKCRFVSVVFASLTFASAVHAAGYHYDFHEASFDGKVTSGVVTYKPLNANERISIDLAGWNAYAYFVQNDRYKFFSSPGVFHDHDYGYYGLVQFTNPSDPLDRYSSYAYVNNYSLGYTGRHYLNLTPTQLSFLSQEDPTQRGYGQTSLSLDYIGGQYSGFGHAETERPLLYGYIPFPLGTDYTLDAGFSVYAGRVTAFSGAPEPATWSMLIGGFGMVGAAMRRRSKLRPSLS